MHVFILWKNMIKGILYCFIYTDEEMLCIFSFSSSVFSVYHCIGRFFVIHGGTLYNASSQCSDGMVIVQHREGRSVPYRV